MTDELKFPALKQAYLQSLPSEQEILTKLRRSRPSTETRPSTRAVFAFGLAGALGLTALVLFLVPNNGESRPHLSAERLQPTAQSPSLGANGVATNDVSSNVAPTLQDHIDEVFPQHEPDALEKPPVVKTNRRKSFATEKSSPAVSPTVKATWSEVGTLLRNGQEAEAQRKIAELAQSEDVETREGALLFQLRQQVQAARKTRSAVEPDVRAELLRLANVGATSSIRLTAKRLLADSM